MHGLSTYDDVVVGAGHNGLTAAAYLARAGRRVLVLERLDHVGGAAVSAAPFSGVEARLSRYSYLVSLLPRRVVEELDLDVRLVRRRYASYTPLPDDPTRGLLVDAADPEATRASFVATLGDDADFVSWQRFYGRMAAVAQRLWPTVLEPLRSADEVRRLVDDDALWDALTAAPLGTLLRETFADDTVRGVVATDGLIGTFADLDDPSLVQNVCFLYHLVGGGTGDWDVPVGGMGAVTDALAKAAAGAGAELVTGADVVSVDADGEVVWRLGDREHTVTRPRPRRAGPGAARRAARRRGLLAGLRAGAGPRRRPAQGQHAPHPASATEGPLGRPQGRVRGHAPRPRGHGRAAGRARRGRERPDPSAGAV